MSIREEQAISQRCCLTVKRKVTVSRTAALMALELVKSTQVVAARIALWAGTARAAAATAAMLGATFAVERDNVVYWKTKGKINNDLQ